MTRTTLQATSAFYQAGPGIRVFRLAMRAAQRLWPALAVRAAARLFGTPLPLKWMNRRPWDAQWHTERWRFEDAGITVYQRAVAPHGPVALLVHGWGGHAGQMLALADTLAQQGMRPVLVEMPAHGASPGSASNLPQFARVIDYVVQRLLHEGHTVRVLAAHSLGAAYALGRGLAVQRLVLLAPAASPREYTRLFAQVFGLSETTRSAMQKHFEAREGVLMPQFEPQAVGPRVRVPTLVVHDRGASINRFTDGQAFAHAVRGAHLFATEGLGHRKILKDAQVLGQVALFAR